ncbi:hypothetical protein BDS110ZK25_41690 [Bradyrhizobium diazoefficiens]
MGLRKQPSTMLNESASASPKGDSKPELNGERGLDLSDACQFYVAAAADDAGGDTTNILQFLDAGKRDDLPRPSLEAVMEFRQVHPEADCEVGRALIAFDRRDPAADQDRYKKETIEYVARCFGTASYHPGLYGIGNEILRRFDPEMSKHWAAEMLGLDRADDAITTALQSALLGVIATSPSPLHLDAALFGIASFVHAHPRFRKILGRQNYKPPFGEHTEYTVCTV